MSLLQTINYDTASEFTFDPTKVEVASSTLRLLDLGGGTYTTTPQLVTSQQQFAITQLSTFSEASTVPGSTAITYLVNLAGVPYYFDTVTGHWAESDGSFAESTSAANINAHASALISDLNLLTTQYFGLSVYLSTTLSTVRPVLSQDVIGYTWVDPVKTVMNLCTITSFLSDLTGQVPAYNPNAIVKLLIACDIGFFHGNNLVEPFTKTFDFNSSGVCTATVIETATPGVKLNFSLTFADGISTRSVKLFNAIVPNQPSINIQNLSVTYPVDFG